MKATYYNDPQFSYLKYWRHREYEHSCEELAIKRLLNRRHFSHSLDLGGGYGRLVPLLGHFSDQVILMEPSVKQRQIAKKFLDKLPRVSMLPGTSEHTALPSSSVDLITLVRVMHHLPDPLPTLSEINRILRPGGYLVLEFANSLNFKSRLKSFINGRPILPSPIDLRSAANIRRESIPFVNHHPTLIRKALRRSHLVPLQFLSVSNFRSPFLKKIIPGSILLVLENYTQRFFSSFYFGPSIFVLAQKQRK